LFKFSVSGASPGRERDDAGDLPVDPGRDPHITGCDVFWDDLEGVGHQRHKLRDRSPIPPFERKQRSDSAAASSTRASRM